MAIEALHVHDDKHIAAVLTYIRSAWGNNATPVKPEQVATGQI
jgi:mono/diheme cytochrome c family protein